MNAQKRDANEAAIIEVLRGAGAGVQQMDKDDGHDLTVFHRGYVFICEIKNPARAWELTPNEKKTRELCEAHGVQYWILETEADALKMLEFTTRMDDAILRMADAIRAREL